ncbi:protein phosphatase 1 regulatory subunit 26 [Discoglossus pictus]
MFLVNVPPVAAFKPKWAPFGQTASCRIPVCFSESEEDISGNAIGAEVQGIINNLKSDESSLEVTSEYECIMQKNRKGELNIDGGLKTSVIKGHTRESATLVVPPRFNDTKEETSAIDPLVLDSDSDDSVDRDIEEAIQEYLKTKGNVDPSHSELAKSPCTTQRTVNLLKDCQKNVSNTSPIQTTKVTTKDICSGFNVHENVRCASPDSVSSDDSFEQSIKDEIEQFLYEKKQQSIKHEITPVKRTAPQETSVKPKVKPSKACVKQSPKQGNKEPLEGQHSESPTLKCLKQKGESFHSTSNRNQPKFKLTKQNENLRIQPHIVVKEELSDSSSDDGIEEAIQLYQLEKSRKEEILATAYNVSTIKEEKVKSTSETAISLPNCMEKGSSPDIQKKADSRKRKLLNNKSAAFQALPSYQGLAGKRPFFSGDARNSKCETGTRATYRAETATELMCAEAILDISKTILPSQPEGTFTITQESSFPQSNTVQPYCDSDSSVDSNDSIEQEIRTFLALKAQAGSACTAPVKQEPLSPEQSKPSSFPKSKLSLTHTRKLKESKPAHQGLTQKNNPLQTAASNIDSTAEAHKIEQSNKNLQKTCVIVSSFADERVKFQSPPDMNRSSGYPVLDSERALKSPAGLSRVHGKTHMQTRNYSSGDKSSSLDSDEDLDTAIKDLLKSKRKIKKRCKDIRPPCKKKVRFGETITKPLDILVGGEQKDCPMKNSPSFIKSCLLNPCNPRDNTFKKSKSNLKRKDEKDKLDSLKNSSLLSFSQGGKDSELKPVCASDNSMTSESKNVRSCAFADEQDSSSVDSDDSIEQEIRKFLAERAREAAELTAAQKVSSVPDSTFSKENTTHSLKLEESVLLNPVTETVPRPIAENRIPEVTSTQTAVVHQLYDSKQNLSQVGPLYHCPVEVNKGTSPMLRQDALIVKRDCIVDQKNVLKPNETCLQIPHGRVILKTDVNGSQGKTHLPISGNFVAGLKYISGTEKQLVLNVDNTGSARVASNTHIYSAGSDVAKVGGCPSVLKKGLVLEKSRDVQTSNIAPKIPLVRPGLYLLTTKVCKENSPSLCLPISAAPRETGINLMSIQYRCGPVDLHTPQCVDLLSLQQHNRGEIRDVKLSTDNIPRKAGEVTPLDTKTAREVIEYVSRASSLNEEAKEDLGTGSGRNMKESESLQEKGKVSNL